MLPRDQGKVKVEGKVAEREWASVEQQVPPLKGEQGGYQWEVVVVGGCKCVWNGCWLILTPGRQGESTGRNVLTHPLCSFS